MGLSRVEFKDPQTHHLIVDVELVIFGLAFDNSSTDPTDA